MNLFFHELEEFSYWKNNSASNAAPFKCGPLAFKFLVTGCLKKENPVIKCGLMFILEFVSVGLRYKYADIKLGIVTLSLIK